ncbi:hypothetical protein G5I_07085 [Acromyrmex echinatior]|uniref:Histone-lysine N-methyltransferase SETMAR n=1 Tax=Acromyrmex echinatior TaxID=103372 RepID=F4WMV0_ACREC|nr:hypothetical protein G5I_07085 [Acromyrmex echinatior]
MIKANNLYIFAKWKKNEFHAVIKYLHMKCLTPKEIKVKLDNIHITSAPAFATVYNWVNEFKRGRTSTCDAPRDVQLRLLRQKSSIKSNHRYCFEWRVKVRELVEATGISHSTVISILHEQLSMKKLSARWVPRLLTVDHKRDHNARVHTCSAPMAKFNEFRYELLPHPTYSRFSSDYFLFPNLKKWFRGKRFTIREQLIAEMEAYFEGLHKSYYLKKLENC